MKATNKTHKITLVSHYFDYTLNLRLPNERFDILKRHIEFGGRLSDIVFDDEDRVFQGYDPIVFSRNQLRKINGFEGCEYYDRVAELPHRDPTTLEVLPLPEHKRF